MISPKNEQQHDFPLFTPFGLQTTSFGDPNTWKHLFFKPDATNTLTASSNKQETRYRSQHFLKNCHFILPHKKTSIFPSFKLSLHLECWKNMNITLCMLKNHTTLSTVAGQKTSWKVSLHSQSVLLIQTLMIQMHS